MEESTGRRIDEDVPFLSIIRVGDTTITGLVCSHTGRWIHVVDYARIKDLRLRRLFLRLCEEWWWNGDRRLPPDAWMGPAFAPFRDAVVALPASAAVFVAGRVVEPPSRKGRRNNVIRTGSRAGAILGGAG